MHTMVESRTSTPEPPQDLWSSILDSVSSSRSIPSKSIVVLGEPSSGKRTIVSALLQKPVEEKSEQRDFAIGYDWADVLDEAAEDTISRLSAYCVPSSSKTHTSLLPHFVPPRSSLPHTAMVIVLDWTRPWSFVEQLQTWIGWIETWAKGDGSRELEVVQEENRERLQSYLQHYTEPSLEPLPATATLNSTVLPLGPGTLTHNTSGVPIIVVCTKADLIDDSPLPAPGAAGIGGMVKGKGSEWEERTDSIMQVLRVICLKYGAALFYTTIAPQTLAHLRQYILHVLFAAPVPSPGTSSATDGVAPYRNPFPFAEKANILDRDRILVPAGWDSWGKIAVLREGFDAKSWSEAWNRDTDTDSETSESASAKLLYAELVPDRGIKPTPIPPFNEPVPEQAFLAKNYDENSKKPDRDPRGAFRNPNEVVASNAGIVGPMGSSSFNLPNVERALVEMEGGLGSGADSRKAVRRDMAGRSTASLSAAAQTTSPTTSRPLAAPLASSTSSSSGQSQHEVLQSFFQSLLNSRDRAGSAAGGATGSSRAQPSTNGTHDGTDGNGAEVNGTLSGAE